MTPRQLWLHFTAGCAVVFTLLLALIVWMWIRPGMDVEQRGCLDMLLAWQVVAALILCGAGVFNVWWGFITAWPMRLMVVAALFSVWLYPLGIWAWRTWQEEKLHLRACGRAPA